MTRKIYLFIFMLGFALTGIQAQENNAFENGNVVTDELTKDPEQNAKWRMGQANYSAKPKDAWELGLHLGHFFIDGDVDRTLPGGYGLGLHLRKAVHYVFSIRGDFFYGQATGLDPQPWTHRSVIGANGIGGGLVEDTFDPYNVGNGNTDGNWFPSHKTRYMYGALQGVINIGNILFHKDRNKWNWYATVGAGFSNHVAKLDLLNAEGNPYTNLRQITGFDEGKFDTKSGRSEIKDALDTEYDGEYETEGFKKKGIFRLGDETNIHVVFTTSMGISRRISKRFNIGLEHQVMLSDNDYLDGIKFRTADDQTNNADIGHYTNIRLAFNLGSMDNRTEPLYWLNPLDATFNDIAELKQRPVLDLTDEDGDGIIDMLDQELGSPAGCAVDTRGVTLDSDNDGLSDCKDKETFSPAGYEIDSEGVAIIPAGLNENDVNRIVDAKTSALSSTINSMASRTDCGKWFLPMVHFDSDKYSIKPEYYGHLHHVANVMKMCPSTCVSAVGHTDLRNGNDYNRVLSYNRAKAAVDYLVTNYGIDRSRFNLMYGGEEAPLSVTGNANNLMNRRVEFRVCNPGDNDMGRPAGPSAGSGGSRSGSTYSGNKNSGY